MNFDEHSIDPFSGHIRAYLESLKARKYSPKTLAVYQRALLDFASFVKQEDIARIQDVSQQHLDAYRLHLVDRELAHNSVHLYLRTVRRFFAALEDAGSIFENPAEHFIMTRPEHVLMPVPSATDIKRLLAQPDTTRPSGVRDRAMLETAYGCALRREELASLSVFDPDIREGRLRIIGKGRKERVVPLGKQTCFWLKQYMETARPKLLYNHPVVTRHAIEAVDEQALWISRTYGKRLSVGRISRMLNEYSLAAGLEPKISPHALRRACATHMLRNGAHPVQIQMLLGHAGLKTLSYYLRVSITDMKTMHRKTKPGR